MAMEAREEVIHTYESPWPSQPAAALSHLPLSHPIPVGHAEHLVLILYSLDENRNPQIEPLHPLLLASL